MLRKEPCYVHTVCVRLGNEEREARGREKRVGESRRDQNVVQVDGPRWSSLSLSAPAPSSQGRPTKWTQEKPREWTKKSFLFDFKTPATKQEESALRWYPSFAPNPQRDLPGRLGSQAPWNCPASHPVLQWRSRGLSTTTSTGQIQPSEKGGKITSILEATWRC